MDVQKSLKLGKVVTFTPPNLDENTSPTQKEIWKIRANINIKCKELLEANLEAIYKVFMSICNLVLKDQVGNHENYEEIDNKQGMLGQLQRIKKAYGIQSCSGNDELVSYTTGKISVTTRIQGPIRYVQKGV